VKKKKEDAFKNYHVDKLDVNSKEEPQYVLTDDAGKQILSSSNLLFVAAFCDRLSSSGHNVGYSKDCLKDLKGVLPFA
jgi:hypothetical protein